MKRLLKTSFIALSALVLPFTASLVTRAEGTTYADDIDTKLEYQISSDGSDIRYISTMELKNDRTLNDITSIQMKFIITDGIVDRSRIETTTTVYDKITGTKDQVDNTYYAVFKITDLTDKYSGWRISSNFTYYFADSTSETVESSSWLIGVAHKYFVQQYTDWGTDLYAHLYNSKGNNGWPGQKMTLVDTDKHIYEFSYLLGEEYTTVVFNNGKENEEEKKTGNMPLSNEYDYYLQQDGNAYSHPTAGHSFTHDTNTHTCSICGYSAGHNLELISETNGKKTVACDVCGFEYQFDSNVIYLTDSVGWGDNIHAHMWNDATKAGTTWPGTQMEKVGTNKSGQNVYKIELLPEADYIIFNNGSGSGANQTGNIPLSSLGLYNAVYLIHNGDWNKNIGTWLCVEDDLTPINQE